jgi:hypothetical protein
VNTLIIIEDKNIDDIVNDFNITIKSRNINKTANLQGDLLMDRTKLKHFVSFKINLIDFAEWQYIVKILEKSSFHFSFRSPKDGQITREFVCEEIPSPRFKVINGTEYYKDIQISIEEL